MRRLVERTFDVRVPASVVWAHLSAVSAWPSWARHIRRVTLDPPGPLTMMTRGRLLLKPALPTTFRVTALDAPHAWSWRGRFLGTTLDYDHRVEAMSEGTTQITFTIDGSGATVRAIGPVFARVYGVILDRAIPNLVHELERGGTTDP